MNNTLYFEFYKDKDLKNTLFKKRRKYFKVDDLYCSSFFFVGDIISICFFKGNEPVVFEGVCLGIRKKKKLFFSNVSFFLRNIILGIGVEVIAAYYYNRLYVLNINNYKRKMKAIRSSRIYFIRFRVNRFSRVA
jgi:ribosomal protein L19